MKYRVIIQPTAERGIRESMRWLTEHASPNHAAKWLEGLIRAIDTLKSMPGRGSLAAESEKFPVEIRELLHGRSKPGKHRILYTIAQGEVHILYVRHSAQDELEP
ncbi:MAG: type II toxin-antitoxin system RelE/ParE family toxin [Isosphaeraceae bacterium]